MDDGETIEVEFRDSDTKDAVDCDRLNPIRGSTKNFHFLPSGTFSPNSVSSISFSFNNSSSKEISEVSFGLSFSTTGSASSEGSSSLLASFCDRFSLFDSSSTVLTSTLSTSNSLLTTFSLFPSESTT